MKAAYPGDTTLFVYNPKTSVQRISVALCKDTSEAVLLLDDCAKAYTPVRIDAAMGEGAV